TVLLIHFFYGQFRHFQHYFQPQYQRWIVRILLMVPVYAFASCLSFRFYWYTPYIEVVRDSYEAFVLYSFYTLLLNYLGPNLDAQHARMQGKRPMKYPVPFCCFWYNPAGYAFLLNTRWLVLQYVVVRPLTTILAMIMSQFGVLCPNSGSPAHGEFWITYANMISSTFAMYGLFTFYIVIKDDVQEWRPLWKIIAVKFIVFFTFWQGLVLDGLISLGYLKSTSIYYDTEDEADMIKSFLVCIEMLVAAALHIKAFPYTEF
ncbi:organic solute transporter subunit alpha/Transmembrane protein, partial [Fimicolochytrium jonesii]|uniref:organic solute transporter subunit alpha/Transmembrane protein n=1 Tax=Fimicolochytrium jonesii TaxID=1396493 RepID=UPI0022FE9EC3